MLPTLAVFSMAVFMIPALGCQTKEYEATNGQCCPMCHEGTVVRRDCTPQYGTRCIACANGTFMDRPNGLTKCFSCASCDPGEGLQARQRCTATANTLCDVVSGYYCTDFEDTGCRSAQTHQLCGPGHRTQAPGTSRTDTVCESCPPGYFSPDGVNCTVWTTCSETQVKAGNTTSDVVCGAASRQRYGVYTAGILTIIAAVVFCIKGRKASEKKNRESCVFKKRPSE